MGGFFFQRLAMDLRLIGLHGNPVSAWP
jgi:hypothetical protein